MSLEDVERMLYSKNKKKRRKEPREEGGVEDAPQENSPWEDAKPIKKPFVKAGSSQTTGIEHFGKKALVILIVVLCIGLGFAGYYLFQYFSGYDISVSLSVPQEVEIGNPFKATILINNNSDRDLFEAQSFFVLPSNIVSPDNPGKKVISFSEENFSEGSVIKREVELIAQGEPYSTTELEGGVSYKYGESVFSNNFERREKESIALKDSVIGLDVTLPESVLEGEEFEVQLEYYNRGTAPINNIEVEYVFPQTFTFQGSDPSLSDSFQFVTSLEPSKKEAAVASGFLSNVKGSDVEIGVKIWRRMGSARVLVVQKDQFVAIAQSPLQVFLEPEPGEEKALSPGERVRYSAIVTNNSREDIYDIVVIATLKSDVFSLSQYDGEGYVDDARRTITWRGSDISWLRHLSPGSSQTLPFDLKLQDSFKDQYINETAEVEVVATSPTVPFGVVGRQIEGRDSVLHRIGGILSLERKLYAISPEEDIENSGPIPPTVGETTTYLVSIKPRIQGTSFNLVSFQMDLSAGVEWTRKVVIKGTEKAPLYNKQTKRVTWNSDVIGVDDSPEVLFQIAFTPSQSMAGGAVDLLKNIEVRGVDSFTQQTKKETYKTITTRDIIDANEFNLDYYKILP